MEKRIRLVFKCSKTRKRFTVNFVWSESEDRYLFEAAIKGVPVSAPGAGGSGGSGIQDLSAERLIWAGYDCPHGCKKTTDGTMIVRCGKCGAFNCSGGIKTTPGGGEYFKCANCDSECEISGFIEEYKASPVRPSQPILGPGESQGKLSGPSQEQLR